LQHTQKFTIIYTGMRSVWKVRGHALLLRVGSLWRGGAVSFSKYLPWQEMCFLQCSIQFSRKSCRPFAASFKRTVEQAVLTSWSLRNFLPRSSLFMAGKAQKSHGARPGLYGGSSNGVPPIHFFQTEHRIQSRKSDAPLRKYLVTPPS
jgi:hypothetical protein